MEDKDNMGKIYGYCWQEMEIIPHHGRVLKILMLNHSLVVKKGFFSALEPILYIVACCLGQADVLLDRL
jgi:hypothetical protein